MKKKSPSQLHRKDRQRQEALAKAVKASASINIIIEENKSERSVDVSTENMSHENEAEIIIKAEVEKTAEPLCLLFKCDQWEYTNTTKRSSFNRKG